MSMLLMKDTSIKKLMRTVMIVVAVALSGFVILTWVKTNDLMDRTVEQQRVGDAMRAMSDARFHVIQIQQFLTDVGATADAGGYDEAKTELNEAMASLDRLEGAMPEMKQRVEKFKKGTRELHEVGVRMAKAYVTDGRAAGNTIMKDPKDGFDVRSEVLATSMNELIDSLDKTLDDASKVLNKEELSDRLIIVGLSLTLFIFLAVTFGIIFSKVIPPLNHLLGSLRDMNNGSGDLTRRLPQQGKDEVSLYRSIAGHHHGCGALRKSSQRNGGRAFGCDQRCRERDAQAAGRDHARGDGDERDVKHRSGNRAQRGAGGSGHH